ncbi:MAG: DUF4397 domain-containing protein [Planctomycetota bacterium]|jgi:hypothetical protein
MTTIRYFAILPALLLMGLVGCGGGDSFDGFQLRAVHASPDAGPVDIYISGALDRVFTDVPYGATSPFVNAPRGIYNIEIRPAGADPASRPVFELIGVDLSANDQRLTVIAAGLLNGAGDEAFRLLTLFEDFDTPGANEAIVRVVHASATAPAVKIDVGDDGSSEVASLARYADTGAAGVALPAGQALQIGIRVAQNDARVTAFTTPELPAGGELFVIATGLLGKLPREEDGFSLLAVGPSGSIGLIQQNPMIYALHAGPDAPEVAIYSNGAPLTDGLEFGEMSDPIQVPPGTYPLEIRVVSNGESALLGSTPALNAGETWLATARGFLPQATNELELDFVREQFNIDDTTALVAVLHSSPDAPSVLLGSVSGQMFTSLGLPALVYGDTTPLSGVSLGTVPLTLGVDDDGQAPIVAEFDLAPQAGNRFLAVAIGSLLTETENSFKIALIDTATSPWSIQVASPNESEPQ